MGDEREILTWELFGTASRDLAQLIADDGYEPDMILSIARGGLLVGGALGYALGVKNVYTMNVEYYTGVEERLEVPRILPPAPDFVDLDDAGSSSRTTLPTPDTRCRACRRSAPGRSARCASRCCTRSRRPRGLRLRGRRTDRWINFPWSDKEPVARPAGVAQDVRTMGGPPSEMPPE